ncbi:MAG: hypothetical protein IJF17_10325 [Thermoguttaceae bacterium]|nr:hypothetical protein [Thermoguttaceae bacterium]
MRKMSRRLWFFCVSILGLTGSFGDRAEARYPNAYRKAQEKKKRNAESLESVPYYWSPDRLNAELGVAPNAECPEDLCRVVYFHRDPGCAVCRKMAAMLFRTLRDGFSEDIRKQRILLRYVDMEAPKFARTVYELGVHSPSLFLVEVRGRKDVRAIQLEKIWSNSGNETVFRAYVSGELRNFLEEMRTGRKER